MPENFRLTEHGLDYATFEGAGLHYPSQVSKVILWDSLGVYLERNYFYKTPREAEDILCFQKAAWDRYARCMQSLLEYGVK